MSDGPDLLERMRMCVAEVGHDPSLVTRNPNEPGTAQWWGGGDGRDFWRAMSLVRHSVGRSQMCWECARLAMHLASDDRKAALDACEATRPCTADCGASR